MKSNANIVREACHIVWTEGQIDRVEEFMLKTFLLTTPSLTGALELKGLKRLQQVFELACRITVKR